MQVGRIYLDTNIFITATESSGVTSAQLNELFALDHDKAPIFVTSQLTFSELLVKPYKDQNDALIDTYEGVMLSNDWLDVIQVEMPTLRYAAVLRAQHPSLKLPDAIHLSTAIGVGCTHFLTSDLGIRDHYQLVHTRYGIVKKARPIEIMRPDDASIKFLMESLSA